MDESQGWPRGVLPADRIGTIRALQEAKLVRLRAEAREVELLAHVADVYDRPIDSSAVVLPGTEQAIRPAGEGTPEFAEFAALEVAAGLEEPEEAIAGRIVAAVGLRHRFPQLWQLIVHAEFPVWVAERISVPARELSPAQCGELDDEIVAGAGMAPARLLRLVEARVLAFTEPGRVRDRYADARARRGVWFRQSEYGVADAHAVLDAADAVFLNGQLNRIAGILAAGGDSDGREVRRAKALGVLASPARALQLLQASLLDQLPEDLDVECPAAGQRGHTCGTVTVDPDKLLPTAQLSVHLTDATLIAAARDAAGRGLVRAKGLKPLLAVWVQDLLGHARVSVRPVIDVPGMVPADCYEVPARMREAVAIRSPHSVFPHSRRNSTGLDLDHTDAYDHEAGAPPGQTRVDNLGPLSRRQHRAKTHGGWQAHQIWNGVFVWRSPSGIITVTTPSQSWQLHTPPARC